MADEPVSTKPARFPTEYGKPDPEAGLLPWSFVEERLRAAPNYWGSTVSPSGQPHARPFDGVWVDGALCFGGSPETRWVRNLLANAAISIHLSSETEAIILDGTAELVTDPAHPLAEPLMAANREKYPQYYTGGAQPFRPFWMLRPTVVFTWTLEGFPNRATRLQFDRS